MARKTDENSVLSDFVGECVHVTPNQPKDAAMGKKWKTWFHSALAELPLNNWLIIDSLQYDHAADFVRWAHWWVAKNLPTHYAACMVRSTDDANTVYQFCVSIQYGGEDV